MATSKEKVLKQRAALDERLKKIAARERATERKSDTRRKVLAGAAVIDWAKRDSEFSQQLMGKLRGFLTRDYDRKLFGLPQVEKTYGEQSREAA